MWGQSPSLEAFYQRYEKLEAVSQVKLQGWLLEMAAEYSDEAEAERLLKELSYVRVMIFPEGQAVEKQAVKDLVKSLKGESFGELMQIRDEGTRVDILTREENESITGLVALINEPNEQFILLSLEGSLRFKDLRRLRINVDGMEHLEKLPEQRAEGPRP
ncbi:MAG: DUF4252 domain-containing protein [Bacteroidota bacterium]